jgi:hypothetical protein
VTGNPPVLCCPVQSDFQRVGVSEVSTLVQPVALGGQYRVESRQNDLRDQFCCRYGAAGSEILHERQHLWKRGVSSRQDHKFVTA